MSAPESWHRVDELQYGKKSKIEDNNNHAREGTAFHYVPCHLKKEKKNIYFSFVQTQISAALIAKT